MRIILFLLISFPAFAQETYPSTYIIKCDGSLKYIDNENLKVIKEKSSLESGILIKPEGIIVFKTGKEQVLKNGELIDENGNIFHASDSLIQEIRFTVLSKELKEVQSKLQKTAKNNDLLIRKSLLLTKSNELLNKKSELLSEIRGKKNINKKLLKKLDELNLQVKTIESKIAEIDKLLPN